MPIYEYYCRSCGYQFEELQKLSEPVLVDCPKCGEPELRKLVSAVAFRLKGEGWYETDFKTDKKRNVVDDGSRPSTNGEAAPKDGDSKKEAAKPSSESSSTESKSKSSAADASTSAN